MKKLKKFFLLTTDHILRCCFSGKLSLSFPVDNWYLAKPAERLVLCALSGSWHLHFGNSIYVYLLQVKLIYKLKGSFFFNKNPTNVTDSSMFDA